METDHWKLREELINALAEDVNLNYKRMQSEHLDLNRRNYIRSLFAFYEADLANLREVISDRITLNYEVTGKLDLHEIYLLMDETASVGNNGKFSTKPNQTSFRNLVKYVLKLACREYSIQEDIFTDGWSDFIASIDIRHKITHPKYMNDISISDEELKIIGSGRTWWNNTLKKIRASK